ncbi:MAG TPA: GH1 family beta-glucosidase [Anaerolineales bacterium]|nr:GH1 family beta-glucosidase [Anaerolineales bacterium]
MANKIIFPKDFLWGAATASYQIDGAWDKHGKGESTWDRFAHTPGKILNNETGDIADDHYRLWKKDIGLMKKLGLQAYRFSISWPRLLPAGRGKINEKGLDFYSRLVDGLLEANIKPFVTLFHWDAPQVLEDEGGWAERFMAEAFVEYTDLVTRTLGDRVKNWITHNEPAVVAWLGYGTGVHAPGKTDYKLAVRAAHHLLLSHGWAVPVIHRNSPDSEAGITLNIGWNVPASNSYSDRDLTRQNDGSWFRWFADPVFGRGYPSDVTEDLRKQNALADGFDFVQAGDMKAIAVSTDFIGLNYYSRNVIRAGEKENEPQTVFPQPRTPEYWTEMPWENFPDGLMGILARVYFNYNPPKLYITENGASYSTPPDEKGKVADIYRTNYLRTHFVAMHRAIQAGVPLAGYFVWSLLDNFEWSFGYSQRFGIIWVDYKTQKRTLKDSAKWYRNVIKKNGF